MLSLDRDAVLDWADANASGLTARCEQPIRPIEEGQEVQSALVALGRALQTSTSGQATLETTTAAMRSSLVQLGPARLMRLLRWFGVEGGSVPSTFINGLLEDSHPDARSLREAVAALNRHELLSRIFDEKRIGQLLSAITAATKETRT